MTNLQQDYAPAEDITFSQTAVGVATASIPTTEWSSISGIREGFRIITDPGTANEGEAVLVADPQFQSLSVALLIIRPISGLTITSGNWQLKVPATKEVKEYLPRHIRNTLIIPEYYDSIQEVTIDEINDAIQRFRNLRRWDVMDPEYLDVFLQTMGMFIKSEQFDVETRRRFIKELPTFIELSGTKFFLNYLSFVVGAFFEIVELWSNDYLDFIEEVDIPAGQEEDYYPTNHVQLTVDANTFGLVDPDLVVEIFYVLASVPLVLQRLNQILTLPDIDIQAPSLIYSEEYNTFVDITPDIPVDSFHHWTFDNISGSTIVDEEGNQDGTITGSLPQVTGLKNQAVEFAGTNANSININGAMGGSFSEFSFSGWVDMDGISATDYIFQFGQTASPGPFDDLFEMRLENSEIVLFIRNGSSASVSTDPDDLFILPTGYYRHIAFTMDASAAKLYIDGVLVRTNNSPPGGTFTLPFARLGNSLAGVSEIDGRMDEVRMYDRVLSDSEVEKLYNQFSPMTTLNSPLNSYTFDNVSGTSVVDESGNQNGTVVGSFNAGVGLNSSNSIEFTGGSNEYMDLNGSLTGINNAFCVSMWVAIDSLPSSDEVFYQASEIVSAPNYPLDGQVTLRLNIAGTISFFVQNNAGNNQVAGTTPNAITAGSGFQHVLINILPSNRVRVYLNGNKEFDSFGVGGISGGLPFTRVGATLNDTLRFSGRIDELRHFDRSLSDTEIQYLATEF